MECTLEPGLWHFVNRLFVLEGQVAERGRPVAPVTRLEMAGLRVLKHERKRFDSTASERWDERRKAQRRIEGKNA